MDPPRAVGQVILRGHASLMFPPCSSSFSSHQNLADQRYGLDPRFRFHVSRAVYKGILRYLASASGTGICGSAAASVRIWPLHLHWGQSESGSAGSRSEIRLNPRQCPASYMVYTSTGDGRI
ncbi:MAG: hypothetical protein MZV63_20900 [Marinilabiliales bacterium]|nr:hypothetical protein [Marinilabiliales bacterium]